MCIQGQVNVFNRNFCPLIWDRIKINKKLNKRVKLLL